MAFSWNESNNSAENEESINSCIRAVNKKLQLSQPLSDFLDAYDEIGAMKAIGTKLGINFETNREIIEVTIRSKKPSMLNGTLGHVCPVGTYAFVHGFMFFFCFYLFIFYDS